MKRILKIIFGLVFVMSGFVKAVDPWGFAYKLQEYFHAANITTLDSFAIGLGILLPALEFLIGFCLIFNLYPRLASRMGLLFMLVFTPLTLYLAIYNPVTDCGCFGDALKITNYQTFGKNVVLLAMAISFVYPKQAKITRDRKGKSRQLWMFILAALFIIGIAAYSCVYLPLIDFRPYKIGTHLEQGMSIPEGSPTDKYESTFIYKKDGVEQTFDINHLPKAEDGWTFVDQKTKLLEKGYEAPIHDFEIMDPNRGDVTDLLVESKGYAFFVLARRIDQAPPWTLKKINDLYLLCQQDSIPFFLVSSSDDETIQQLKQKLPLDFPVCSMDDTTIKTIIRSNPGVLLLKDGTITQKWSYNSFPNDWKTTIQ